MELTAKHGGGRKSLVLTSLTRRYLKLVIGSVHLLEGHKRAGE